MEKLKIKYQNLLKVHARLSSILKKYTNPPAYADEEDIEAYMTTLIKRFELTQELVWKFFKLYLKSLHSLNPTGSKDVFRKCFDLNIISEQEILLLLNSIEDRNMTAHEYDNEFAHDICKKIEQSYYAVLTNVIQRIPNLLAD